METPVTPEPLNDLKFTDGLVVVVVSSIAGFAASELTKNLVKKALLAYRNKSA